MIKVIARHMEGGEGHEYIAEVKWINDATGAEGRSSKVDMITWLRQNTGQAYVEGPPRAYVGVFDASPPYLRTYADGIWNNNLLALPEY